MNQQCNPDAKAKQEQAPAAVSGGGPGPKNKPKPREGFQLPTLVLPPRLPPVEPPGGWASGLMKRLAEWVLARSGALLAGIGVFVVAVLFPHDAGVTNEWAQKLPDEEEARWRELEKKRRELAKEGKVLPVQEYEEWLALDERKFPHGRDDNGPRPRKKGEHTYDYESVEIINQRGEVIGEFDGIDTKNRVFIEDKSAEGLDKINPRTGLPSQRPEEWATKQILNKTNVRIANLEKATGTRPTKGGSSNVPDIGDIKDYRKIHFEIDNGDPKIQEAVKKAIEKLKEQNPDWEFSADFGR